MAYIVGCSRESKTESPVDPLDVNTSFSGTIVFQSDRSGNWDIFRVEADGSSLVRLTSHKSADLNPAWAPDGSLIAFSSERTGAGDIYVMSPDGNNIRRITDDPSYEGAPRFTPDGKALIFEGERDGRAEVYSVELASREVVRVTNSIQRKLGPVSSPDGKRIAFMEKSLIRWHISVRSLETGEKRAVTRGGGACRPDWSPDGRILAFVSTRDTAKADLWFREMNGSRDGRVWRVPTRKNAYNYDPSFSPDGLSLAMASTISRGKKEQWDIFLMNVNGRDISRLTGSEGNDRFPDWKP